MSLQPVIINNVTFAKNNSLLEGEFAIADLERLTEWLQIDINDGRDRGCVKYKLKGGTDAAKQNILHLSVDVAIEPDCQRCFKPMSIATTLAFTYLIKPLNNAQLLGDEDVEEPEDVDLLPEDHEMDFIALVEDEVIASMPYSLVHDAPCGTLKTEAGEKPNPFAALKDLVNKN